MRRIRRPSSSTRRITHETHSRIAMSASPPSRATARVLLLSATPVHNAGADLDALLALFLGSRAEHLTPAELSGLHRAPHARRHPGRGDPPARRPVWCDVTARPRRCRRCSTFRRRARRAMAAMAAALVDAVAR